MPAKQQPDCVLPKKAGFAQHLLQGHYNGNQKRRKDTQRGRILLKQIFVNLKRFDITPDMGGVNRLSPISAWGNHVTNAMQDSLNDSTSLAEFIAFFPEAHLPAALAACRQHSPLQIGCQSVYREDTAPNGNFGAFTTNRTANAMKALGCRWTIIGHCEERRDLLGVLSEGKAADFSAVDRLLNRQALCAVKAGLRVLYCIGETVQQRENWKQTLQTQLETGLHQLQPGQYTVAYEPVWAIGPGKTPPDRQTIQQAATFIKAVTGGAPLVYGGGLKQDNAAMLASIPQVDGGLIALTRFTGDIGFYPQEYGDIVKTYLGNGG